jgi:hypothetical protein
VEEALILRGYVAPRFFVLILFTTRPRFPFCPSNSPQPKQLDAYTSALERLNASIAFGSVENQRDTVRVEPLPSPSVLSLILLLISPGKTSRNWRQKARPAVHKGRRLRLVRQSSCGHRIPVLCLPAGGTFDSPAARQVSPRASVACDASISPCCGRHLVCF